MDKADPIFLYDKANNEAIAAEIVYSKFCNALMSARDKYVPRYVKRRMNKNEPIWFNKNCSNLVNKQRRLYNKYKNTGHAYYHEQYKN